MRQRDIGDGAKTTLVMRCCSGSSRMVNANKCLTGKIFEVQTSQAQTWGKTSMEMEINTKFTCCTSQNSSQGEFLYLV